MSDITVRQADRVSASVGVTRNLGNYNNVKLDAQWETEVREGETVEEALERAFRTVEAKVEKELNDYTDDED